MSDPADYDIRYTQISDAAYLRRWILHDQVLQWMPLSTESEIENGIQCWVNFSRWNASLTATIKGIPCGIATLFLMPYRKVAHQACIKIIVDVPQQKKGIGTSLMKNLKHLSKNYFKLEVLGAELFSEKNPLVPFLIKENFHEVFRQEKFLKTNAGYEPRIYLEMSL